ncbi:hypothetical protein [Candidatus Pseudothioglobus sp. Uisw_050_01]|uniref:hypothetical protein n=1 Tax=Candidatus Pseudothioglobus sp. Uisw_050_01 TaxID=3230997 RepID=UPI003A8C74C0
MKLLLAKVNNMKISRIWIIFLIYSSIISLVVQFIVLPLIFPSFHRGSGVMYGGDWVVYQYWSDFYATYIAVNGWSYWSLYPQGFGLVGVTSAIYAFFGISKPFILIPLYSSLHAFGSLCIVLLMQKLGIKRSVAFFSALPYLIFPSSVMWVSQILKDVFTLNATLIMLYGVVSLFGILKANSIKAGIKLQLLSATLIYISFAIVFVIRPYMVELNYLYLVLLLISFNIWLVYKLAKRKIKLGLVVISIFIQLSLLYMILQLLSVTEDVTPKMSSATWSGYTADAEEENNMNILKLKALDEAGLLRKSVNRYWEKDDDVIEKKESLLSQVDKFNAERASKKMMKEIQAEMVAIEKINAYQKQLTSVLLDYEESKASELSPQERLEKETALFDTQIAAGIAADEMMKETQAEMVAIEKINASQKQLTSALPGYEESEVSELLDYEESKASELSPQERLEKETALFDSQIAAGIAADEMMAEIKTEMEFIAKQAKYEFINKNITSTQVDGDIIPRIISESDAEAIAYAKEVNFNPYIQKDMSQLFEKYESRVWQETALIPYYIDQKFKKIYDQRSYFYLFQSNANSTFDSDKDLNSSIKMLEYLPRALQVAYLAPFPRPFLYEKFKMYRSLQSQIMQTIVQIEMLFIYISLSGLVFAIYLWRRKVEFWVMISFSLFFTVFPVYAYPNVGALVRYRYAGIMLITAICLCALVSIYLNYKNKKL